VVRRGPAEPLPALTELCILVLQIIILSPNRLFGLVVALFESPEHAQQRKVRFTRRVTLFLPPIHLAVLHTYTQTDPTFCG
jgi:hypothetical protein